MQIFINNETKPTAQSVKKCVAAAIVACVLMSFQRPVLANSVTVMYAPVTSPVINPLTSPVTAPIIPSITIAPTPAQSGSGTSNNGQNNSSNNSSSQQTCNDIAPTQSPRLFQIKTTNNTATLTFTPVTEASSYTILYGVKASQKNFSVSFSPDTKKGAVTYTIHHLSANKTYYFSIRANKGCVSGNESNMLKATTTSSRFHRARTTTAWEQMKQLVLSWIR